MLGAGSGERYAAAALAGHGLATAEAAEAGKPQSDAYAPGCRNPRWAGVPDAPCCPDSGSAP